MKNKEQLKKEIMGIDDWRHPFELEKGKIVENKDKFGRKWMHDFQFFKRDILLYILRDVVPALTKKELKEMTIVDIGCNDGYFSIEALKTGLKKGVGLELREESVRRANLIKDYYGVDNIEFRNTNIEEVTLAKEKYDITLFLGLLYHLTSPVEVLMQVSSITSNVMIIMTFIIMDSTSSLRLIREDANLPGSGAKNLITRPSEKAVVDMLEFVGFNEVARYYPYPFFDFGGSDSMGINVRGWAVYIACKSDKDRNIRRAVGNITVNRYYDKNLKNSQWVILKSFDNGINCLTDPDMRFKSRVKRKIASLFNIR